MRIVTDPLYFLHVMASVRFRNGYYYYRVTLYKNGKRKYVERGKFSSYIDAKEAGELAYPRKTLKSKKQRMEPGVVAKIFERFPENHPAHLPLKILYYTGCTVEEAYSIKASDLYLDKNVWITRNRTYNLDTDLTKLLKRHLHKMIEAKIVFMYENSKQYLNVYLNDGRRINKNQVYYLSKVIRKEIDPLWNVEFFKEGAEGVSTI